MIFFSVNVTKILDHLISDTGSYLVTKEKIDDRVWLETSNMEENVKRFGKWSKIKRVKVKK